MDVLGKLFGKRDTSNAEKATVAAMHDALRFYRSGAYSEALDVADRLIEAGPNIPISWRFRGECLFSLGRYAESVVAFDKAAAIGGPGTEEVLLSAALALHNGGEPEKAKARLRQVLAKTSISAELRVRVEDALSKIESADDLERKVRANLV